MNLSEALVLLETSEVASVSVTFDCAGDGTASYSQILYFTEDGTNQFNDKDKSLVETAIQNFCTEILYQFPADVLRDGGHGHVHINTHRIRYSIRVEHLRKNYEYYAYNDMEIML